MIRIKIQKEKREVMRMELNKLLTGLFDLQRLEADPGLQSLIDETEERCFTRELTVDELDLVSAAGDTFPQEPDPGEGGAPLWQS